VFLKLFGHFQCYSCLLLSVISVVQLLPNVVQVLQMFIECCRCYAWCFSQVPPLIPLFLFMVFSLFCGWCYPYLVVQVRDLLKVGTFWFLLTYVHISSIFSSKQSHIVISCTIKIWICESLVV
jgi:hypothetical protein